MIVAAANALAESAGIQPGMTLADARALEPAIRPADADFPADARALDGLADWCGRYTPWVGWMLRMAFSSISPAAVTCSAARRRCWRM